MEDQQPKTFRIPRVKYDAIIKIEVSGAFLQKCQQLLMAITKDVSPEDLTKSLEKFKLGTEAPAEPKEAAVFIMLALISEIEKEANAQGKVEVVEITPEQLAELQKTMAT